MRTIVNNISTSSGMERHEVRSPIETYLTDTPPHTSKVETVVVGSNQVQPHFQDDDRYGYPTSEFAIRHIAFEVIRFVTIVWVESSCTGGVSFGYYNKFISYSYIPEGADMSRAFEYDTVGISSDAMYGMHPRQMEDTDILVATHHTRGSRRDIRDSQRYMTAEQYYGSQEYLDRARNVISEMDKEDQNLFREEDDNLFEVE